MVPWNVGGEIRGTEHVGIRSRSTLLGRAGVIGPWLPELGLEQILHHLRIGLSRFATLLVSFSGFHFTHDLIGVGGFE